MAIAYQQVISGSAGAKALQINAEVIGGIGMTKDGKYNALPTLDSGASMTQTISMYALSSSFSGSGGEATIGHNRSVIGALNYLKALVSTAAGVDTLGELTDVTLSGEADNDAFYYDNSASVWKNTAKPEFDLSEASGLTVTGGGTGATTLTDGGVLLGSGTGAVTAMAVLADGEMIVGDGTTDPQAESGATLRTSIGVGTGDSPQFTGIELGAASDTTLTRVSAGVIAVEGDTVAMLTEAQTMTNKTLTSPTLTTPNIGTPSAGTLTSCTGLPISSGVSGLASNVATFLGTSTSANLASAVTDETGSGALVFATSPTLVTPALGTPSAGVLTSCTGLPVATGLAAGTFTTSAAWSFAGSTLTTNIVSGSGGMLLGKPSSYNAKDTDDATGADGAFKIDVGSAGTINYTNAADAAATVVIGGSAEDIPLDYIPYMTFGGVDEDGKLQYYKLQVSGGLLQINEA